MKLFKVGIPVVVVLGGIYMGVGFYAQKQIQQELDTSIPSIVQSSPLIESITYDSVNANAFTLFTHKIGINDVKVTLKNHNDKPIEIQQITMSYKLKDDQHLTDFDASIKGMKLHSAIDIAAASFNAQNTIEQGSALIETFNPLLNANLTYKGANEEMNGTLTIENNTNQVADIDVTLDNVNLSQTSLAKSTKENYAEVVQAIQLAKTKKATYHFDLPIKLNEKQLTTLPQLQQILGLLDYKTLEIAFKQDGSYNTSNKAQKDDLSFKIKDGGALKITKEGIIKASKTNPNEQVMYLKEIEATYHDDSLFKRILTAFSNMTGTTQDAAKQGLIEEINSMKADTANTPMFKSILNELANFIDSPKSLTVSLKPKEEIDPAIIEEYFSAYQEADEKFHESFANIPAAEREKAIAKHHQAQLVKLEGILKVLNFTVKAN